MPGIASSTGLISARVKPISRPKKKNVDLSGSGKPAPFTLRPFAGLFNPYPYGCSVLCNHPADCEAKEVVRRAKESWATEGKALLLPAEVEMIRANFLAITGVESQTDATAVPEELFRKYTETDSRPLTPAPTLASGPLQGGHAVDESPRTCQPRERTTLVLDLRAESKEQAESETLSWHAMTLEPAPGAKKVEVPKPKVVSPFRPVSPMQLPQVHVSDVDSQKCTDDSGMESPPMIRRGKRLKKRKNRRSSIYGQLTEVRDHPEPLETQVSQENGSSRKGSEMHPTAESGLPPLQSLPEKISSFQRMQDYPPSFIHADLLKQLGRELDRETVEAEFSMKRKIALEEALRVKGHRDSASKGILEPGASVQTLATNVPRVFSRQVARFELLDSQSLHGTTPLEYVSRHVYVTPARKMVFSKIFNRYCEDDPAGTRRISATHVHQALGEVLGKPLSQEQEESFASFFDDIRVPLDFRQFCGVSAVAERLLARLPLRDEDPPVWLERVDFQALERRLELFPVDPKLVMLLKTIKNR